MSFGFLKKGIAILILTGVLFSIPQFAAAQGFATETLIAGTLSFTNYLAGALLQGTVDIFGKVLRLQVYQDLPAVVESWRVVRDFANIFFILGIIVMAFSVILDLSFMGGQDWRTMLGRFIFIALIINFSLAISGGIIQGTQIVSNVFLNSIGDASVVVGQFTPLKNLNMQASDRSYARIWGCFIGTVATAGNASGCQLGSAVAGAGEGVSAAALGTSNSIQLFVNTIVQVFMTFSLGIGVIFAFLRIPILWFLMVIAPLAWVCGIFPSLRKYHQQWWDVFLSWNFFLPIYLLFLYFGFFFLSRQDEILGRIQESTGLNPASLQGGFGLTFQEIMVYAMACMFLVMGARMAFKTSSTGGAGATAAAVKGRGLAVGKWLSYRGGYREAAEQRWKQFRKEGPFGSDAYQRNVSRAGRQYESLGQRLGVAGLGPRDAEKKFYGLSLDKLKLEYDSIVGKFDKGQITKNDVLAEYNKHDPRDPRGFAYRKLMIEKGFMPKEEYLRTLESVGDNPYAIQDLTESAKKGKFGLLDTDTQISIAAAKPGTPFEKFKDRGYTPFRQDLFNEISTDERRLAKLDDAAFNSGMELAGGAGTTDGSTLLKNVQKLNPIAAIQYKLAHKPETRTEEKETKDTLLAKAINVPHKDIATMILNTWKDEDFQKALEAKITDPSIDILARRKMVATIQEEIDDHPDKEEKKKIFLSLRKFGSGISVEEINESIKAANQQREAKKQQKATANQQNPSNPSNQQNQRTPKNRVPRRRIGF